ncbi:biotin--[acetyl-CoA-carboxylase] ligase [Mongoliitalea daihaiensis]|uniref:biotin--[acetyl-CoA-carboxylase] ligase n=1 Tax=Mongoliitalea daihaiensis TaxID=2782006 RepID=UPI001F3299EF|nr:biotin--[acetyl-CoA-carboxylase] ligase [Mongoliitalea daihaiensis]UJP65020.1 biotin--[acetyl-CoA-carboxylase] ligase [Mongoliitalea daihaiensis]
MHKILANTVFLGKEIIYLTECHSTNDFAQQLLKNNEAGEGVIVFTDKQTKGKGQRGNRWWSEPGMNLTFSLVLEPKFLKAGQQFDLNIVICLSILELLQAFDPEFVVKWPNDVLHKKYGKIAGVLIENTLQSQWIESSVVGIGLNVNQNMNAFPGALSLCRLTQKTHDIWEVMEKLVQRIEWNYIRLKRGEIRMLKNSYLKNLLNYQQRQLFSDGDVFEGVITGVTEDGKLLVNKKGEIQSYGFKEIQYLGL